MKVKIGITEPHLKNSISILSSILANEMTFYIKLRKFHWNLKGPDFMQFHRLFEEQYEALEKAIDEVAERISTLGGMAIGTTIEFAELSQLKESPGTCPAPLEMAKEILQDHESIVKSLRTSIDDCEEKYEDKGTADSLTGLMQDHEKMAWQLRQYFV